LISLAIAVTTPRDGCIDMHIDAGLKAGATREEISEALGVAVAMNAGGDGDLLAAHSGRRGRKIGASRAA
jgi:AhpD family alkylhydroperoxidase